MSTKANKNKIEMLVPGASCWELWSMQQGGVAHKVQDFPELPGSFTKEATKCLLALPATALWVLPAWIKGETAHLRDMAQLHMERISVRLPEHAEGLVVDSLNEDSGAHLTRIMALRDMPTPLSNLHKLPDECLASANCYHLSPNSITVWRELGKLVAAITVGPRLVYFSALSSSSLDQNGLAELNNICLQLTFQRVLNQLDRMVLWTEEGDPQRIRMATGMEVVREDHPQPRMGLVPSSSLMPLEVITSRESAKASSKRRLMLLTAGFVTTLLFAAFALIISMASRERDDLLQQVAEMTPRASKVGKQKAAWEEVGSSVDPDMMPMGVLLRCMEAPSSGQVAITHFECAGDTVIVRGRAPDASPALKYIEEIKNTESLGAYTWESGTPQVGEQGTEFEIKGTRS